MLQEKILNEQIFAAFPHYKTRTKEEALQELGEPCGRFSSPFTMEERARLFVSGQLGKIDMLENVTGVVSSGVPLNWHALLRYLHQKGLISKPEFKFNLLRNDLPKFYAMFLEAAYEEKKTDGRHVSGNGHGHAQTAELAMSKAVGETLERHLLTLYSVDSLRRASVQQLREKRTAVLDITQFNAFLPWQQERHPRFKKNDESPIYWTLGETIGGDQILIPAQCVFWSYSFSHDKEEPILYPPTTSAAGGGFSKQEAILSGLLEHIERDGFLIYWLNHLSPKVIDVTQSEHEEIQKVLSLTKRYGLQLHFLNTTSDVGVPSVICAIIDDRADMPIIAVGAGTGFDLEATIVHSAYEALIVLNQAERFEDLSLPHDYVPFVDKSIGHLERIRVWRGKEMLARFAFFISGEQRGLEDFMKNIPQDLSPSEQLQYVVAKLRALGKGYEPFVYEVRHEVLKTLGYHVVQTVVPQLLPIYLDEHLATLDSRRLREVPAKLGCRAADTLNPWPHPFP